MDVNLCGLAALHRHAVEHRTRTLPVDYWRTDKISKSELNSVKRNEIAVLLVCLRYSTFGLSVILDNFDAAAAAAAADVIAVVVWASSKRFHFEIRFIPSSFSPESLIKNNSIFGSSQMQIIIEFIIFLRKVFFSSRSQSEQFLNSHECDVV